MQGVMKVLFQKSNFFGKNLQSKKSIRDLLVYIIPGNRGAVCEGQIFICKLCRYRLERELSPLESVDVALCVPLLGVFSFYHTLYPILLWLL